MNILFLESLMNPLFYTFLFFFIIFSVAGYFVYYAKTVDKKIQQFLISFMNHQFDFKSLEVKRSERYLKSIGEVNISGLKYQIFTNNLEATLNRQIIFETTLPKNSSHTFFVERNIYTIPNDENIPGFDQFRIYNVRFSELGNLATTLGVMKSALEQKKNKSIYKMLQKVGILDNMMKISVMRKLMGIKVINQYWKFYIEEDRIGFLIDWGWMKEISTDEFKVFCEIVKNFRLSIDN